MARKVGAVDVPVEPTYKLGSTGADDQEVAPDVRLHLPRLLLNHRHHTEYHGKRALWTVVAIGYRAGRQLPLEVKDGVAIEVAPGLSHGSRKVTHFV